MKTIILNNKIDDVKQSSTLWDGMSDVLRFM